MAIWHIKIHIINETHTQPYYDSSTKQFLYFVAAHPRFTQPPSRLPLKTADRKVQNTIARKRATANTNPTTSMELEELTFLKVEMKEYINNALSNKTAKAYSRNNEKYDNFFHN